MLFIPKFGVYGICIATLLAHTLSFTLLAHKLKLLKEFWHFYILPFILLLALYIGYFGLVLIPILVLFFFLFRFITLEDIKVIKDTIFSIINLK